MKNKQLIYVILLASLMACRKEITIPITSGAAELVVNSFFEAGQPWEVNVSKTQNILDNDPVPWIDDATVNIYDNNDQLLEQLTATGSGNYKSSATMPEAEKQYRLEVLSSFSEVEAIDSCPQEIDVLGYDTLTGIHEGKDEFFQVLLTVRDPVSSNDFYKIFAYITSRKYIKTFQGIIIDSVDSKSPLTLLGNDLIFFNSKTNGFSEHELLLTDKDFDGQDMQLNFGSFKPFNASNDKPLKIEIFAQKISPNNYNFSESRNAHLYYQDIPYSRPVEVISNIRKGYGIFGGFTEEKITIEF